MVPNKASTSKLQHKSFTTKASTNGGQLQFSKASHTLDQDSVKQNQFMLPNKASTSKLHLQSFNTKASPQKLQHKSFITKALTNGKQLQFSKASHTLDQDSVKQNQFMVPNKASTSKLQHKSFTTKASPQKLQQMEGNYKCQKLHTLLIKIV
ncbi:hypothetical protein ACFX19_034582 [Malus domestica]